MDAYGITQGSNRTIKKWGRRA